MTDARGVSTVLDVSLFLLLVSASAFVLTGAPTPSGTPDAAPTAAVLATSTATAEYRIGESASDGERTNGSRRIVHGTLANLLAAGAVGNATVDGSEPTRFGDGFERAIRTAVEDALVEPRRTEVVARWRPYGGRAVAGEMRVGRAPPSDASVGSVRIDVPSGLPPIRERARRSARTGGFDRLSHLLARSIVRGLFPTSAPAGGSPFDGPTARVVEREYRRTAASLGVAVVERDGSIRVEATNERLVGTLAPIVERDLRRRYATPSAAARTVSVSHVRITVRRWAA